MQKHGLSQKKKRVQNADLITMKEDQFEEDEDQRQMLHKMLNQYLSKKHSRCPVELLTPEPVEIELQSATTQKIEDEIQTQIKDLGIGQLEIQRRANLETEAFP